VVLSCTLTDAGFMDFPWSFHAGFMLVTCWVCKFSLLVGNLHDNSLEPAWNLHGTSMEPASGVDAGNIFDIV